MTLRALILLTPVLLGALAGRAGLFAKPDMAIRHLNRYALYFGFPALVLVGILDAGFELPTQWQFWTLVPSVLCVALVIIRALGGREAGTMALVASFGNVAYLGLPVVEQAFGAQQLGVASLIVAMHVTLSMIFGPLLLLRWSGEAGAFAWRKVLAQPLLWAPLIGLLGRSAPDAVREGIAAVLSPIGSSAAPVALFLLGLYLWTNRRALARVRAATLAHAAIRIVLIPGLTGVGAIALGVPHARVFVVLACMPAAITTFAIAEDLGVGKTRIAQTIVLTSLLAVLTIPATIALVIHSLP